MFELYNPKKRAVECVLRGSIGTILVAGESFVPTPEQEKKGLTADLLEQAGFVPKLLKPTPPAIRRRLLQASGIEIPEDVVAATSHLAEFGGTSTERAPVDPEEVVSTLSRGKRIFHKETIIPPVGLGGTSEAPPSSPETNPGSEVVEDTKVERKEKETPPKTPNVVIPDELKEVDKDDLFTNSTNRRGSTQQALKEFADAAEEKLVRGVTRRTRSRG